MRDEELGARVRLLATAWVDWLDRLRAQERGAAIGGVVQGHRMVNGGQTGGGGDEPATWEVTDAETGELLAEGVGEESFDAAWQSNWVHADAISRSVSGAVAEPTGDFGLPPGLANALEEWVIERPEEARGLS